MFEASQPHFFANLFGYNRIFTTFLSKYLVVTEFFNNFATSNNDNYDTTQKLFRQNSAIHQPTHCEGDYGHSSFWQIRTSKNGSK